MVNTGDRIVSISLRGIFSKPAEMSNSTAAPNWLDWKTPLPDQWYPLASIQAQKAAGIVVTQYENLKFDRSMQRDSQALTVRIGPGRKLPCAQGSYLCCNGRSEPGCCRLNARRLGWHGLDE